MTWGLVLAAAVVAIAGGTASSQAASPSLIVFSADRAPYLSGEIYRIDSGGRSVDLSNDTAAADTSPVISPDGKRVAFLSNRGGQEGVYEVGVDGSGLVQVAPSVKVASETTQLAWQPHGGRLAVATGGGVWIVQPGGTTVRVPANYLDGWTSVGSVNQVAGWSPDGRMLAVTANVHGSSSSRDLVLSPTGHKLWAVPHVGSWGATWSPQGRLAVTTGRAISVYDRTGHLEFKVRVGPSSRTPWSTWSPGGSRLALVSGRALQVRTATGHLLLRKALRGLKQNSWLGSLAWVGNGRLVVFGFGSCGCHLRFVAVPSGQTAPASSRFGAPTSADQRLAILRVPSGDDFEVQVAPTAGGAATSYGRVPACDDVGGARYADFGAEQFVPHRRSLVYASECRSPVTSLYSVAPGGGPVHRITTARSLYWSPALSPDGSRIASAGNPCAGLGCSAPSSSILVLDVDGSGEHTLATPAKCAPGCCGNYDESPTWSPDGATILFGEADCNSGTAMPELYTVPASGGTPHDLGFKGYSATWGPSRIAYVNDDSDVWTANPDGTDPVAVGSGMSPAWSPTGQLAYLKNNGDVVVGATRMRFPFASVTSLAWSPDGTRLVVSARKTATSPPDLYSINPNGSDPIQLTQNYDAYGPSWR